MAKPLLVLFFLALPLGQIYVLPSGLPQPGDILMAVLVLVLMTGFFLRIAVFTDLYFYGGLFLAYESVVNLICWAKYGSITFVLTILYFLFNFGSLVLTLTLFHRFQSTFINWARWVFGLAIMLQLGVVLVTSGGIGRAMGTFNNPNQFGYASLLLATCYLTVRGKDTFRLADLGVLGAVGILVMASLSKAAIVAYMGLVAIALVSHKYDKFVRVALLTLVLVGVVAGALSTELRGLVYKGVVTTEAAARLRQIGGQDDDSLGGRGYDRFWLYPQYVVFGAGEGAYQRFSRSLLVGKEMHSSFGTILFSYGIFGFALFCLFLVRVFEKAPISQILYLGPIVLYGSTHQGVRDTLLWVFFAMSFYIARHGQVARVEANAQAVRPPADQVSIGWR